MRIRAGKTAASTSAGVAVSTIESWSTAEIGDAAVATVRCVVAIPGGVALGSDYGLTLWRDGAFVPFPWPAGSRREARRVEAMAVHDGALHVGTSATAYRWNFSNAPTFRKHGQDEEGGWDELFCMLSFGGTLYAGWRTKLEGASGPADVISLCAGNGVVYAGTRAGGLYAVHNGVAEEVRRFEKGKGRPVRHLAWAGGCLWVAAADALHRWDGSTWESRGGEPTAFTTDASGKLWSLGEGKLWREEAGWLRPVPTSVVRPWSLAATADALWIGGKERVWRVRV